MSFLFRPFVVLALVSPGLWAQDSRPGPALGESAVGIVCHVKVTSDRVPDMTNLETWKKAYLKEGMSDEQKAMAVWKTVRTFQHQEAPPLEFLQNEDARPLAAPSDNRKDPAPVDFAALMRRVEAEVYDIS